MPSLSRKSGTDLSINFMHLNIYIKIYIDLSYFLVYYIVQCIVLKQNKIIFSIFMRWT